MGQDEAPTEQGEDVEMAEVRLLSQPGETSGRANSWYSANGRGYSVNGTQTETTGQTSHIATVLGEAFYARERRKQRIWECITEWPSRAFNLPALGLAVIAILFLVLLLQQPSSSAVALPEAATATDPNISPEGRIQVDLGMNHDYRGRPRRVECSHGAVAADHGRCSDIGVHVLEQGGNAVDAAVATALCQGIYNPMASGIGGGTFMLIRLANGTTAVIDAREMAPAAANETMFSGNATLSLRGGLAIGVPLELKGLWKAHQLYGSAQWSTLVQPAADLARNGFPAHPYLVNSITDSLGSLQDHAGLRDVYLKQDSPSWRPPTVNETCCVRPQLAVLLDEVALHGPDALYNSTRAEMLANEIQAAGGVMTAIDLLSAQPEVKAALNSTAYGLEVIGPPPPSSAATVIAALHVLEDYTLPYSFSPGIASHRLVEAMKTGFALRTHLGDPGSCTNASSCFLNLTSLLSDALSPEFASSLRNELEDSTTQATSVYGGIWHANSSVADDHGTSHISVVDNGRSAVAMTTTINTGFGSGLYSKSTGLLLNNQMDDFSTPGQENVYGLAPSKANFIRPGKKPLSSMSPMMLADPASGDLRIVVGASGGPRIISAVLSTIVRLVALGNDPLVAVAGPRLHHQLLPDYISAERWNTTSASFSVPDSVLEALQRRGHVVVPSDWGSVVQLITVDPDTSVLTAVSDPRKDGAPAGY